MKRVIISLVVVLGAFGTGFGQKAGSTSDQTSRGSGRINPSTLAMEFDLPLASYPGRGINVPISLSYSSKLWQMDWQGSIDGGIVTGGCRSLSEAKFSEKSASGWTTSLATPYIEYIGMDHQFNSDGFPLDDGLCVNAPPPANNSAAYIRRITVHLPSGESHELRADDTPVIWERSSQCPPAYGYSCDPNSYWLQANWDRTYYATDGSNIKYIEDSTSNPATYRLQMPDGSFYDFESARSGHYGSTARKAVKFTDRNGNYTSYNPTTGVWAAIDLAKTYKLFVLSFNATGGDGYKTLAAVPAARRLDIGVLDADVFFSYIDKQVKDAATGLPPLKRLPVELYSTKSFAN